MGVVVDLLKQFTSRVVLPSQHISDVFYHKPFMRCSEQKHSICSLVKGCYRWVIVFVCSESLDEALSGCVSSCL
jgi:hypothetical protein